MRKAYVPSLMHASIVIIRTRLIGDIIVMENMSTGLTGLKITNFNTYGPR